MNRSAQSASCQAATVRRYRVGGSSTANACATRARSVVPEVVQEQPAPADDDDERDQRAGPDDPVLDRPRVVERRQRSRARRATGARPASARRRRRDVASVMSTNVRTAVERDDRRVRAPRDRAVGEEDPHDVAAAGREDRVDADARDVRRRGSRAATARRAPGTRPRGCSATRGSCTRASGGGSRSPRASGRIAMSERKSQKLSVAVRISSYTRSR